MNRWIASSLSEINRRLGKIGETNAEKTYDTVSLLMRSMFYRCGAHLLIQTSIRGLLLFT